MNYVSYDDHQYYKNQTHKDIISGHRPFFFLSSFLFCHTHIPFYESPNGLIYRNTEQLETFLGVFVLRVELERLLVFLDCLLLVA